MSSHQRCCILGLCCPPGSAEQEAALVEFLDALGGKSRKEMARALLDLFGTGPHEKQLAALADG